MHELLRALFAAFAAAALAQQATAAGGEDATLAAMPSPVVAFAPEAGAVPTRRSRSGTPLVTGKVNGAEVALGIDTGAGLTVLTRSLAERVGAKPAGAIVPRATDSLGKGVSATIAVVDLEVAGALFTGLPVLVVEDERLQASFLGVRLFAFEALLGWNALARGRAVIDFEAPSFSLGPGREGCAGRNLRSVGARPLIDAQVNGVQMQALVDTGAGASFLAPEALARLQAPGEATELRLAAGASGAHIVESGAIDHAALAFLDRRVAIAKLASRPAAAGAVHSLTLGLDALGKGRLTLDLACGEARLER